MVATLHQAAAAGYYLSCMRSMQGVQLAALPLFPGGGMPPVASGVAPAGGGAAGAGGGEGSGGFVAGPGAQSAGGVVVGGASPPIPGGGGVGAGPGGGPAAGAGPVAAGGGGAGALYYSGGVEPDGLWWNPRGLFPEVCQDGRPISPAAFARLYAGFAPDSETALTQNAGDENRSPGLDVTFSADKSVVVLWVAADRELRGQIEDVHHAAVRQALEHVYLAHCAWTRRGKGGREVVPADILGATFQHGASRENEPQLHTHCVVFNAARTADDGRWRAVHQAPWYRWVKTAGAVYRNALAHGLRTELGIEMVRHGEAGEFVRVASIPEEVCEEWSSRARQIEAAAWALGFDPRTGGARTRAVAQATRAAKSGDADVDARIAAWQHELAERGWNREEFLETAIGRLRALSAEEQAAELRALIAAAAEVPGHLTVHEAIFRRPDVLRRVAELSGGTVDTGALQTLVDRVLRDRTVLRMEAPDQTPEARAGMAHTQRWSTRRQVAEEVDIGTLARSLAQRNGAEIAPEVAQAAAPDLSDEQRAAIRHLTAPGDIAIIEGAAGSGKSVTLRPVADLHRAAGYRVLAAAVAWRTALALGADCDARPFSMERLLRAAAKGQVALDDRTLLVVDEAGMLPVRAMHRVLTLAGESGAKVILVGDREQLQPVEAGPGLRLAADAVGSVRVDAIRRQQPDLEDLIAWRDGVSRADAQLRASMATPADIASLEDVRGRYGGEPWQAEASRAIREQRAGDAIAAYAERGRFHLCRDHLDAIEQLAADWAAHRRERPQESRIVIARTNREVRELSLRLRAAALGERARPGAGITIRVGNRGRRQLEVAPGDLLKIGATCWRHGLFNGSVVEVASAAHEPDAAAPEAPPRVRIRGRRQDGRAVDFLADEIRDWFGNIQLDYGYALTVAAAQGSTADRAFLLTDDRPARETLYPAATRHRNRLDFYLSRRTLAVTVAESRPEDRRGQPVRDEDILAHLARLWSREGQKEAALDFASDPQRARIAAEVAEARKREEQAQFEAWLRGPAVTGAQLLADSARAEPLAPALARLARFRSSWTRTDLEIELRRGGQNARHARAEAERLLADPRVLPLYGAVREAQPRYTLTAVWAEERQLAVYAGRLGSERSDLPARWRARALRRAVRRHRAAGGECLLAEALARGTGLAVARTIEGASRRRALAAAADTVADSGGQVIGLAPTRRGLGAFDGIVGRTRTVDGFLRTLAAGEVRLARDTVAIVAGAGQLDATRMLALVKAADESGVRLALTDDTRMGGGIGRTAAFDWLARQHDPGPVAMELPDHVPEADAEALRKAAAGDWAAAMAQFDAAGNVHLAAGRAGVHAAIAAAWVADPSARKRTRLVIAGGQQEAAEISAAIQAARADAGQLGKSVTFAVAQPRYTEIDGLDSLLEPPPGGEPDAVASLTVHVGDRLRIGASPRRSGISAGDIGTVTWVSKRRIGLDLDGRRASFDPREHPRFALGYALGRQAARHVTAARVDVAAAPGWSGRALLAALTRHRAEVAIYADADRTPDARSIGVVAARQREDAFSQAQQTRWEALEADGETARALRAAWARLPEAERARIEERDRQTREQTAAAERRIEEPVWAAANDDRIGVLPRIAARVRASRALATHGDAVETYERDWQAAAGRMQALRREAHATGTALRDLTGYAETVGEIGRLGAAATEMLAAESTLAPVLRAHSRLSAGDLARHRDEARREQAAASAWEAAGPEREIRVLADVWRQAREESLDLRARLRGSARSAHKRFWFARGYAPWIESVRGLDALAGRLQQADPALAENVLAEQGGLARIARARERFGAWLATDARERAAAHAAEGFARKFAAREALAEEEAQEHRQAVREWCRDLRFWGPHLRAAGVNPDEAVAWARGPEPERRRRSRQAEPDSPRKMRQAEPGQGRQPRQPERGPPGWSALNAEQRREWVAGLSRALASQAEDVCARLLPGGRVDGPHWCVGSPAGEPGDSMKVNLAGPHAGRWRDFATGEKGDLLDLFRQQWPDPLDTYREAANWTGMDVRPVQVNEDVQRRKAEAAAREEADAQRRTAAARRMWNHAAVVRDASGTAVEAYLAGRGIASGKWEALRYHPTAWLKVDDRQHEAPAMFAAITDAAGNVRGVHRTFLGREGDGWGKSAITDNPRRMLGQTRGHGVRFGAVGDDGRLVVGEGIETVLSVLTARPDLPGVACLAAPHLAAFELPPGARSVLIAADDDPAGRKAAGRLAERCREQGVEVTVAVPPGAANDWNDALQADGVANTRAALDQVLGAVQNRAQEAAPGPPDSGVAVASGADTEADVRWYAENFEHYIKTQRRMVDTLGMAEHAQENDALNESLTGLAEQLDRTADRILAAPDAVASISGYGLLAGELRAHQEQTYRPRLEAAARERAAVAAFTAGMAASQAAGSAAPESGDVVRQYSERRAHYRKLRVQAEEASETHGQEAAFRKAQEAAAELARELDQCARAILDSPQQAAQLETHGLSPGQLNAHRTRDYEPDIKAAAQRAARDHTLGILGAGEAAVPDNPEQAVKDYVAGCERYGALLGTISDAREDRAVPEQVFAGMVREREELARVLDRQAASILASREATDLLDSHGLSQAEIEERREREYRMILEQTADRQRQHQRRRAMSRGRGRSL